MRRLTGSLTVIALLVIVPAASAKEVSRAEICGAGTCAKFTSKTTELQALAEGGDIVAPPAKGAPHYLVRIKLTWHDGHASFTSHWVPALNLIRGDGGTWMTMPPAGKAMLAELTAGLEPLAAPALPLSASRDSLAMAVPTSPEPDQSFPWTWLVTAALAAAGLLAARELARRRSPRRGTSVA